MCCDFKNYYLYTHGTHSSFLLHHHYVIFRLFKYSISYLTDRLIHVIIVSCVCSMNNMSVYIWMKSRLKNAGICVNKKNEMIDIKSEVRLKWCWCLQHKKKCFNRKCCLCHPWILSRPKVSRKFVIVSQGLLPITC